ncbi:MAG: hypothetical protein LBB89_01980 [Treponema sp.]|jgi:hypothetical protein|nr:hypothetical protein [Treponema sp.]
MRTVVIQLHYMPIVSLWAGFVKCKIEGILFAKSHATGSIIMSVHGTYRFVEVNLSGVFG